jgi:hypothetical protein
MLATQRFPTAAYFDIVNRIGYILKLGVSFAGGAAGWFVAAACR